ncbi:MAG: hypothetical protein UT05_C0010G0007 [Parcubacteria group bacterium GW2011_GWF2_38_76]|nr:MAG: hypothetical protein UT05_C0010G0007 [Parcubacteria group bacterium GW2011_GWF2_38_76]HBM45563.1 hypothetical protein [Patescibacteria group bacterium]
MKFLGCILVLIVACVLFSPSSVAMANQDDIRDMLLGALAGGIFHEAAHHFAAGKDSISWHGPILELRWKYKGKPGTYGIITKNGQPYRVYYDYNEYRHELEGVAKTGMISEGIISHYLNSKNLKNKHLRNFRKGFVLRNILNNIYYLTLCRDRGDMDPDNFTSDRNRKIFKRLIAIDTGLLLFEFISKRSLLPKGTSISLNRKRIILKKTWRF